MYDIVFLYGSHVLDIILIATVFVLDYCGKGHYLAWAEPVKRG